MKYIFVTLFLFSFLSIYSQSLDVDERDFSKADSIAKVFKGFPLKTLPKLSYRLTHQFDNDIDKFRAIFTWVSTNISASNPLIEKVIRKRKKYRSDSLAHSNWNTSFNRKFFNESLLKKSTVCTGYAYLVHEMALMAGIESTIVNGYLKSSTDPFPEVDLPNHSWNAVKLNNKWYLCDATLASGYFFVNEDKFIFEYQDNYFLAPPEIFEKSHFPLDKKWTLLKDSTTFEEFVDGPIIYNNAFSNKITPIYPKSIALEAKKGAPIEFQFKLLKTKSPKAPTISMVTNDQSLNAKIIQEDDLLKISYAFKHKGIYDVHFNIGEDTFTTYSVRVSR